MTPDAILDRVSTALDRLIAIGDDHHGLFPSILDLATNTMRRDLPPAIPGQRDGDRAPCGCNLIHDQAALKTLYGLATALDRPTYAAAADRYLCYWATHCTGTASGLFPWGEHSYWHLLEDRVGNSYANGRPDHPGPAIHDHLRQAPVWLWEKLLAFNPECVQRCADGLDYHWTSDARSEYIRHAPIDRVGRQGGGNRSCDFPRHGGFYLLDWAFAYRQQARPETRAQLGRMLDYWWAKRDPRGLLLIESRTPETDRFYRQNAPGQTLSLACSLYETAALLADREPELAALMRERAAVYTDGFCAAPHDPEHGIFVILSGLDDNSVTQTMPIWGSVYGVWPASYIALVCLCQWRLTQDPRLWQWAVAAARCYATTPFPAEANFPVMDAGLGLGLLADLYDITGDTQWRDDGLALADRLVTTYLDHDLPRSAATVDWYDSQTGPSFLLHGLARMALLAADREHCPLTADYTAR